MANVLVKDFTAKTTPVDADVTLIIDSEASNDNKKITFGNIKAFVKSYLDTFYQTILVSGTSIKTINSTSLLGSGDITISTSVSDGDKGDITVSGSGTVWNIDAAVVGLTELSASGTPSGSTFLRGDNTWAAPAGGGDVSKVGTPVNNQVGVWTGDGTIEGDTALTFDTTTDTLSVAASGNLAFGAVTVLDDNAGTTTLSNIDAIDVTTETTIEAAIDTLANLTSIQGRTVTLADAGANAVFGWDDVAGAYENLTQAEVKTIIGDAAADATTKGIATFTANDFNASSGNISIDYTNAQKATTTQAGFLTELATTAEIDTGTDSTRAMPVDQFVASTRNVRYVLYRILDSGTDVTTGTTKGGDFEFPFTGTITAVGGFVDTAGTTGTMVVDINKAGSTIMTTNKLSFDSTEKTTRTAATQPTLTTTAITAGDILTFDIDTIQTTPAKGLTVRLEVRLT